MEEAMQDSGQYGYDVDFFVQILLSPYLTNSISKLFILHNHFQSHIYAIKYFERKPKTFHAF